MFRRIILCLATPLLIAACDSNNTTEPTLEEIAEPSVTVNVDENDESATAASTDSLTTVVPLDEEASTETSTTTESDSRPVSGGFSMNGFRYCEILLTFENDNDTPVTEVWGTQGVGPCLDEAWYAIDPEALKVELEATAIRMNGPRYFVVDGAVDTAPPAETENTSAVQKIRNYGGIDIQQLATISGENAAEDAYQETLVERTVTWTFNAGTEIYELTDPNGDSYVMQSYSLIQDRSMSAEDLATLGNRLDLPDGWTYNARTLQEPLQIALVDGGAIVVQDEFENSYQRN